MSSTFVLLKVRNLNHVMPAADFWLGFVIYHFRKNPLDVMEPFVSTLEIAKLGLTVDRRRNGEFYYPIEIRNKNRTNPQVMDQYLIEIRDINSAFAAYAQVRKVDFVIASRRNSTLAEIGGDGFLDIITSAGEQCLEIKGEMPALSCNIALTDGSTLGLVPEMAFTSLQGAAFTGCIDDYVTNLINHQNTWHAKECSEVPHSPEQVPIKPVEQIIIEINKPEVKPPVIRKKEKVVYLVVVIVLVFCGYLVWAISGDASYELRLNTPPEVSMTEAPILSLGDSWVTETSGVFQREDQLTLLTHEVSSVDGRGYDVTTRNAAGRVIKNIKINKNFDLVSSDDGVWSVTYNPGLNYYDFPMYVGKKWHREVIKSRVEGKTHERTARITKITIDGLVLGEEEVELNKTLMKTFKVQTIVSEPEEDDTITHTKNVAWYSSVVKRPVMTVSEVTNSSGYAYTTRTRMLKYKISE